MPTIAVHMTAPTVSRAIQKPTEQQSVPDYRTADGAAQQTVSCRAEQAVGERRIGQMVLGCLPEGAPGRGAPDIPITLSMLHPNLVGPKLTRYSKLL